MTPQQIDNCLVFLDRAPMTGHREREAMNELVAALVALRAAAVAPPEPQSAA